jgi:hypothetical protein
MVLILACVSSTMNAFGRHSELAATAFFFNSVIHAKGQFVYFFFLYNECK